VRTTINLDDDVAPAVKKYAESRSISVGKAVSELVRKGIHASLPTRVVNGIHVIDLPADSPRVTACHVRELQEEV
jgi:O-acetyl-ADP-ribose deacetylase (regulator of RNase III)